MVVELLDRFLSNSVGNFIQIFLQYSVKIGEIREKPRLLSIKHNAFMVWHFMTKYSPSRTKLIQAPDTEYMNASCYIELFIENIGQPVKYIIEIWKEFSPVHTVVSIYDWILKFIQGYTSEKKFFTAISQFLISSNFGIRSVNGIFYTAVISEYPYIWISLSHALTPTAYISWVTLSIASF